MATHCSLCATLDANRIDLCSRCMTFVESRFNDGFFTEDDIYKIEKNSKALAHEQLVAKESNASPLQASEVKQLSIW